MGEYRVIATGLRFPEGPVWLSDGSVALVEIERGTISIVAPDGAVRVLATPGGGPNGMAVGPDGNFYVCNNGGFIWSEVGGLLRPGLQPPDYSGGRIERVDPSTGAVTRLYDSCDGHSLRGPNDIVFDRHGGFYFTDLGKSRPRDIDHGGVYYALADGSRIVELAYPMITPNGIGLSPDGNTLYVAETRTARLWAFDLEAPGVARKQPLPSPHGGRLVCGLGGFQMLDSLKVDANGNICVATLITGAVTVIAPDGRVLRVQKFPDPSTTNICFGGPDLRTAYVTLSGTGKLVALDWVDRDWPVPGLRLHGEI
ncbi:SMP-30/gluconolactonase/LRE family protein [Limobrevibacterium gyesilva]|uniref:SMP-30/gluconolactonase/LRE family protein n=1 Tax=Limobrevibacterium gyesilva TaxID=2991712 RepID=A0AA42CHR7_9PROT|nr:SMP-30/gluconolactonase/LRE family protein [Limobrevibacterium gyesilva]MCW3475160.1 SMP-30/gluconolactonase/LRE family protein [Limobrevibacterium gyesilva]